MAIYHLSMKPVGRRAGRSATAAAAYRAADRIRDLATGQVFDYTRKRGVEHTDIVLPRAVARHAGHWARDRARLWNAAEQAERRRDSRVGREWEIALPAELDGRERRQLVERFAQALADRYGCAVDLAIHAPHRDGDPRNHHAHLLATTRTVEPDGLGRKTNVELGERDRARRGLDRGADELRRMRAHWAVLANEALEAHGHPARIDPRRLAEQGIERSPTRHLGPSVASMERRGVSSEVGDRLEAEARALAQARLDQAVALDALEGESETVERAIEAVATEIARVAPSRAERGVGTRSSIDAQRRAGRERWLAARSARLEAAPNAAAGPGRVASRAVRPTLAEIEARALRQWREYRVVQGLARRHRAPPMEGHEGSLRLTRDLHRVRAVEGPGLDGPDVF